MDIDLHELAATRLKKLFQDGLNSNKGTKRDMGFGVSCCSAVVFALQSPPKCAGRRRWNFGTCNMITIQRISRPSRECYGRIGTFVGI